VTRPTAAIARHALLYGTGSIVGGVTRALLLPVVARTLSADEFGVLSLLLASTNFLHLVFELGLVASLVRFHHASEDARERRRLRSLVFLGAPLIDLVLAAPFLLARDQASRLLFGTPEHGLLVAIAIGAAFFGAQFQLLLGHLRADDRSRDFAILMAMRGAISLGVTLWLVFGLGQGVRGFLLGNLVGPLVVVVIALPRLLARIGVDVTDAAARMKTLLAFGLPLVPSSLGLWALTYLDAWLLRVFADLEAVGVYGYASEICLPVAVLLTSVHLAWPPFAFARAPREGGPEQLARVFRHLFVVITGGALAVALLRREVLAVLGASGFRAALPVVPLLALGTTIYAAARAFETGLMVAGQTRRLPALVVGTTLANAALNVALIPSMREVGAGLAIVISNALLAAVVLRESNRHFPIPFDPARLARVLAAAALVFLAGDALPSWPFALGLAARIALLAAFGPLLVVSGAITSQELRALPAGLRDILRRREAT
jgi:O-antigen/teichoic acid export membrane protein